MAMSKEADSLCLDNEGMDTFEWQPQAEIHLDAAGIGLDYASAIKFKKKTYDDASARLKTFGTICKLMGQNHATTTLRDFTSIHSSHKKSPTKLWKYLQHRFSGQVHQPRLIMNFADDINFITEPFVYPAERMNMVVRERMSSERSPTAIAQWHDDLEWHSNSMPELISASDSSSDDEE
jgi:hypothetical protein